MKIDNWPNQTKYRLANPEKVKAARLKWKAKQPKEKLRAIYKRDYFRTRNAVFDLLGHECGRCGFSDKRALQVDHVNGGGTKEHKAIGNEGYYRRALKHPEDYQILCCNCNWIKRAENNEVRRID